MDNEKQFSEFVGTASERAGALAGKVASIGDRIAGFAAGGVSAGKEMLGLADEKVKRKSEKKSGTTKTSTPKSDLAAARRKLDNAKKAQSRLELQLRELKAENHSLISRMDEIRSELNETKSRESAVRARAAALESELDDVTSQLKEAQSKPAKTIAAGTGRSKKKAELESELAAIQQELKESQNKAEQAESEFASQLEALQAKNDSLSFDLEKTQSEAKRVKAELESEISALQSKNKSLKSGLEKRRVEGTKRSDVEKGLKTQVGRLETDLSAAQQKLTETQNKAEEIQADLVSQLKDLQVEKESLISDLKKAQNKVNKIISREEQANEQAAKLESELAAVRRELTKTQNQAKKDQIDLGLQLKDLQVEKEVLISDLKKAQNKATKITSREEQAIEQAAKLESELAATRQKLAETQNQAQHTQAELNGQLEELHAENESLISELDRTRKAADDAQMRADSMETMIASLESNVAEDGVEPEEVSEEKSDTEDISLPHRGYQDEPVIIPTVEEIDPSLETDLTTDEPVDIDVEKFEEPQAESPLEREVQIDVEETEPEPIPEIETTEPVQVTVEDVQAADFKNEAERIIFSKALSDFTSVETAARVDAARAIGSVAHDLSARVLITHIANEPSAVVRQECIKSLTTLEITEGLSVIESALTDETASVRLAAVWGIYRLAGVESLPKLLGMLSDNDEGVRRRTVTCIGWLGAQLKTIDNSQLCRVISDLIERLNDPAESIREATLDALQAVTGKTISTPKSSPERLVDQWRSWWKDQLLT